MYKRCIMKNSDLEPKSLFHMVQFLMYCMSDNRTGIQDSGVIKL